MYNFFSQQLAQYYTDHQKTTTKTIIFIRTHSEMCRASKGEKIAEEVDDVYRYIKKDMGQSFHMRYGKDISEREGAPSTLLLSVRFIFFRIIITKHTHITLFIRILAKGNKTQLTFQSHQCLIHRRNSQLKKGIICNVANTC